MAHPIRITVVRKHEKPAFKGERFCLDQEHHCTDAAIIEHGTHGGQAVLMLKLKNKATGVYSIVELTETQCGWLFGFMQGLVLEWAKGQPAAKADGEVEH